MRIVLSDVPLNVFATVTLDGTGAGTAQLPLPMTEIWRLTAAAIVATPAVKIPTCKLYIGPYVSDAYFIDGTYTGSVNSTSNVAGYRLNSGDSVWAVWTSGDPGAKATLSLYGSKDVVA